MKFLNEPTIHKGIRQKKVAKVAPLPTKKPDPLTEVKAMLSDMAQSLRGPESSTPTAAILATIEAIANTLAQLHPPERPRAWEFTITRNDLGRITGIEAQAKV